MRVQLRTHVAQRLTKRMYSRRTLTQVGAAVPLPPLTDADELSLNQAPEPIAEDAIIEEEV